MGRFSDLQNLTPTVTVRFELPGCDPIEFTVTYRLNVLARKRLQGIMEKDDFVDQLLDLIERWDLEDDDGTPVPVTKETLEELPMPVLMSIFDAIIEHARPDRGELKTPVAGLPVTGSSDNRRRGTRSSR